MRHFTWEQVRRTLSEYPEGTHYIRLACPEDLINAVQAEIGVLPAKLVEMLRTFNGAELFINAIAMITVFGLSPQHGETEDDWPTDWYIDTQTKFWRTNKQECFEWVIAILNYGNLIITNQLSQVREWDVASRSWLGVWIPFDTWIKSILEEGDEYMNDE